MAKYGYVNEKEIGSNGRKFAAQNDNIESLIMRFQYRYGLNVTGELDRRTLKLMTSSRCGNKEHVLEKDEIPLSSFKRRPKRYKTLSKSNVINVYNY